MKKIVKLLIIIIFMVLCLNIDNYSNNIKTKFLNKNIKPTKMPNEKYISIPKINLYHEIIKADDKFNNLNNNIVYYKNLNIDEKIILFGHSGIGFGTYFNRIDELIIGDIMYLYLNNNTYKYTVINTYLISKYDVNILDNNDNKILLITCDKKNKNNRLVVELNLK